MKIVKILIGVIVAYVAVVVIFESSLGYFQPKNESTLELTVTNDDGAHTRVLSRIEIEDRVYVAVNHWPRMWYYRVLEYPEVMVTDDGTTGAAMAVAVTSSAEIDEITAARPLGLVFRILTGFPPRYFVRLDPKG